MPKPKTNKVYKVTCAASGASYTVRPSVWEKRLARFNVDSETLSQNYLGREALKQIRDSVNPISFLHELQRRNNIPEKNLLDSIWEKYIPPKSIDDDVKNTIHVSDNVSSGVEKIETITA